mgnify:CR=1 FL=1
MTVDDSEGMDALGLVDYPAHSKALMTFSKDSKKSYFFNDEQQILMGVAIATSSPIYRETEQEKFYVIFDKANTRKIGQKMLSNGYLHNVNEQHDSNRMLNDITLDQLFYIDKDRGVECPGCFASQNLKDGSMIISYKVHGLENWNNIKSKITSGEIQGFSIEGYFDREPLNIKRSKKSKMKKTLKQLVFGSNEPETKAVFDEAETTDGVLVKWEGDLEVGTAVFIMDEEGNDLQAPEGTHSIMREDGNTDVITLDANGIVVSKEIVEGADTVGEEEIAEIGEVEEAMSALKNDYETKLSELAEKVEALAKENEALKGKLSKQEDYTRNLVDELDNPKKFVKADIKKAGYKNLIYKK